MEVDKRTNRACQLGIGQHEVNGDIRREILPYTNENQTNID